jgi:hypothetical protein
MAGAKIIVETIDKGSGNLAKAAGGLKNLGAAADKAKLRTAALTAKQDFLGRQIAKGNMTLNQATREYGKFRQGLDKSATASAKMGKNIERSGMGLKELATKAALVTASVAAFGFAAKKAFDLAREGAQIIQLEQSFDRMNKQVFKAPNLLNDMSRAVKGTVKEVDLMRGLLTLTAGTTKELSGEFAKAAPRLLEISKAASKLNPMLGDTAFMYQSIATGIKRSSSLILDNLGLVIKQGEAHEKYAASIGKAVDELTGEDKQMALLNAVLETGTNLIAQVGGNVDATTDAFDQLTVQMGESWDQTKRGIAVALTPLIESMVEVRQATNEAEAAIDAFISDDDIKTISDYRREVRDFKQFLDEDIGTFLGGTGSPFHPESTIIARESLLKLAGEMGRTVQSAAELERVFRDSGFEVDKYGIKLNDMGVSWIEVDKAIRDARIQNAAYIRQQGRGEEVARGQVEEARVLAAALDKVNDEVEVNRRRLTANKETVEDYADMLGLTDDTVTKLIAVFDDEAAVLQFVKSVYQDTTAEGKEFSYTSEDVKEAEERRAAAHLEASLAAIEAGDAAHELGGAVDDLTGGVVEYAKQIIAAQIAQDAAARSAERFAHSAGLFMQTFKDSELPFFNETLDELGPKMVLVGGRTADQTRLMQEAQDEYKRLGEQIVDLTAGYQGLFMEEDERADKLQELTDRQAKLIPYIADLEGITGKAALAMREATINEEALTQALFDQVGALAAENGALEIGARKLAEWAIELGLVDEAVAENLIRHALLTDAVGAVAQMVAEGTIPTMTEAREVLLQVAEGHANTAEEAWALRQEEERLREETDLLYESLDKMADTYEAEVYISVQGLQGLRDMAGLLSQYSGAQIAISGANFQHGGPVRGGVPIIVGEAGPELFVPPSSGQIVPNHRLQGESGGEPMGGGGNVTNNITFIAQTREAMALALASVHKERRAQMNSYMGV